MLFLGILKEGLPGVSKPAEHAPQKFGAGEYFYPGIRAGDPSQPGTPSLTPRASGQRTKSRKDEAQESASDVPWPPLALLAFFLFGGGALCSSWCCQCGSTPRPLPTGGALLA